MLMIGISFLILFTHWLCYNVFQKMMEKNQQLLSQFCILFIQGVQFIHAFPYIRRLFSQISLPWILPSLTIKKRQRTTHQPAHQSHILVNHLYTSESHKIFLIQRRNVQKGVIQYWVSEQENSYIQQKAHIIISIDSPQAQQTGDKRQSYQRQVIRVRVKVYKINEKWREMLKELLTLNRSNFVFKANYCRFNKINQIQAPKCNHTLLSHDGNEGNENEYALLVNQHNLKEIPFFKGFVETIIKEGGKVKKIIGHASSLFLQMLIDPKGQFSSQGNTILEQYKLKGFQYIQQLRGKGQHNISVEQVKKSKLKILENIIGEIVNEQNLLDESLVSFVVQNVVNESFLQSFVVLVRLYYRIFLQQQIDSSQIERAILNEFYKGRIVSHQIKNSVMNFSSFLAAIEYRHSIENEILFTSFARLVSEKTQNITFQDLYNYNHIQFTFTAIDLTDSVVRFLNRHTTPHMPIRPIVQLVQFLPIPYKSIIWNQSWGQYKINYKNSVKYVDLTNHQLIDSRFLLQCPMDLLLDENMRECYLGESGIKMKMHGISPTRRKVQEMGEIDELSKVLKQMKSQAIDSIPKLKLIWKIITSKNKANIQINNIQTFKEVKILNKVFQIDQSYKHYLQNLNKEANKESIYLKEIESYSSKFLSSEEMLSSLGHLKKSLDKLKKGNIIKRGFKYVQYELQVIGANVNKMGLLSYDEVLLMMQRIRLLIRTTFIKDQQVILDLFARIQGKIGENSIFIDINSIMNSVDDLLSTIAAINNNHNRNLSSPAQPSIKSRTVNSSTHLQDHPPQTQKPILSPKLSEIQQTLLQIGQELSEQANKIHKYISEHRQKELVFIQYDKCMYRITKKLHNIFQNSQSSKELLQFYFETFQVTPHLYNHQHIHKEAYQQPFLDILRDKKKQIGIILPGSKNTVIQQAQLLLAVKQAVKRQDKTLAYITSTNHHAMLSILFSMNLEEQVFLQESIAFQFLIKTNNSILNQENLDVVNILTKDPNIYQFDLQEQSPSSQKPLLLRKYQNIYQYILELQDLCNRTNPLKMNEVIALLNNYDLSVEDGDILFKEMEIIKLVGCLLQEQRHKQRMSKLLKQNEKMLKEKIFLNKIGINFLIRFCFRNAKFQNNWVNIHKSKYHSTDLYRKYVVNLFDRYQIPVGITLQQFQLWNPANLGFIFVLVSVQDYRYEIINSEKQGEMKMIDLVIAAISSTIQFNPKKMPTSQHSDLILNQLHHINKTFHSSIRFKEYWSNHHLNNLPFNLIQIEPKYQQTSFIAPVVLPPNFFNRHHTKNYQQKINKLKIEHIKCKQQMNKNNIKETDLLSMWWTKPKKLTLELKQLIFSNIYGSPFLKYYKIIQNSSYEHLLLHKDRNIAILSYKQGDYLKGRMMGHYLSKGSDNQMLVKLNVRNGLQIVVQPILRVNQQKMALFHQKQQLKESQQYTVQVQQAFAENITYNHLNPLLTSIIKLKLYYRASIGLVLINIAIPLSSQQNQEYLELNCINQNNKVQFIAYKVIIDEKFTNKIQRQCLHSIQMLQKDDVQCIRCSQGYNAMKGQSEQVRKKLSETNMARDSQSCRGCRSSIRESILRGKIDRQTLSRQNVSKMKRKQLLLVAEGQPIEQQPEKLALFSLDCCFCYKESKIASY